PRVGEDLTPFKDVFFALCSILVVVAGGQPQSPQSVLLIGKYRIVIRVSRPMARSFKTQLAAHDISAYGAPQVKAGALRTNQKFGFTQLQSNVHHAFTLLVLFR